MKKIATPAMMKRRQSVFLRVERDFEFVSVTNFNHNPINPTSIFNWPDRCLLPRQMLDNPPDTLPLLRDSPPMEPPLDVGERATIIARLHAHLDAVQSRTEQIFVEVQALLFRAKFNKLEGDLNLDVINHILALLIACPPDWHQRYYLYLLRFLAWDHKFAELLVSSGALHYLTHDGFWSSAFPDGRLEILRFLAFVLDEEPIAQSFVEMGFGDLLFRQYDECAITVADEIAPFLLLPHLVKALHAFARFPHLLTPSDHGQLVRIVHELFPRVIGSELISDGIGILQSLVESPNVDMDLILQSEVVALTLQSFDMKLRGQWAVCLHFLGACVRRPELIESLIGIDVFEFAQKLLPGLEGNSDFEAFCFLLSGFLAVDPTPISVLIQGGLFESLLAGVNQANFATKREFAELLVVVVSNISADDLALLMSDALADFFFDVLEASSETGIRSLEAFSQLTERAIKFGMSECAFVVRLVRFLHEFPDDLTDLIDALIAFD
jgi:hypothetical protein